MSASPTAQPGTLYGVGIGPGDPQLLTLKAASIIASCDVVAYHAARHGRSIARLTAAPHLHPDHIEELLQYPLTVEQTDHPGGYQAAIEEFYREAAARLAAHLSAGRSVALLAAGDPLLYSSFMHMYTRLEHDFRCEIIPGITSVSAVSAAAGRPLAEGDEVLTVVPGTLDRTELVTQLAATDSAVVLKLGRTFGAVREALAMAGRLDEALYVERASTAAQRVLPISEVDPDSVPYFSAAVIPSPTDTAKQRADAMLAPAAAKADSPAAAKIVPTVTVVGIGPGPEQWITPETSRIVATATDIVGYASYTARIQARPGLTIHASDNQVEIERATFALDLARRGRRVVVVSGGDPGVFAMASAVFEAAETGHYPDVIIDVLPGVTAATAAAARIGAPLGHDFAVVSLSDRLKPWDVIERRLRALLNADLVIAVYNPASHARRTAVAALKDMVVEVGGEQRTIIQARDVGRPSEQVDIHTAEEFDPRTVDMRTLLIIGSSRSRVVDTAAGRRVYTPRSY